MTIRARRIISNYCLAVVLLAMTFSFATALSGLVEETLWSLGTAVVFGVPSWIFGD